MKFRHGIKQKREQSDSLTIIYTKTKEASISIDTVTCFTWRERIDVRVTFIDVQFAESSSESRMTGTRKVLYAINTSARIVTNFFSSQTVIDVVHTVLSCEPRRTFTGKVVYQIPADKVSRTTVFVTIIDVALAS